ncbi:MAG: hypothetical protein FJ379_00650 [Verrucomicrobia bacterium]|nr:hypothetical protein [Verrucomicrobiota bacterium]
MNNTRQLMLAWKQYSLDNNENVVNNFGIDTTQATITLGKRDPVKGYRNWVNNVMSWAASEDITNKFYLSRGPLPRTWAAPPPPTCVRRTAFFRPERNRPSSRPGCGASR